MKPRLKFAIYIFLTGALIHISCKKEKSASSVITTSFASHPPVANAGVDQIIRLPTDSVWLDGSASTGTISSYQWRKISGLTPSSIQNASAVKTYVNNLFTGIYQFELTVTNAGGLFSKDSIQVYVNPEPPPTITCAPDNRPFINSQLVPSGALSQERIGFATAGAGNKILFAGGHDHSNACSSRVDILDVSSNTWTTAELSIPRYDMTGVGAGNKIFFAGGILNNDSLSSRIDIYDVVTNSWSTAELSLARSNMAAGAVGNKVLFAGGYDQVSETYGEYLSTNRVDIYDLAANSWATSVLSERRGDLTANVIGSKIYFAGGRIQGNDDDAAYSTRIDIYDAVANSWYFSYLYEPKAYHAGISFGNKIYWAGGYNGHFETAVVQIYDANTNSSSLACLSAPRGFFDAVEKNNRIVFFTGYDGTTSAHTRFDIYEPASDTWSVGALNQDINGASIISVNNTIYVAGGLVNGVLSNQVWKLEF